MKAGWWTPDWQSHWDPEVGLWWAEGPGHTVPVRGVTRLHNGVEASRRLLQSAQVGQLGEVRAGQVLGALRRMQVTAPGEKQGCFRWYWEEPEPVDTNAAFFISLNLLALHLVYRKELDMPSRELLDAMLSDARLWFLDAVAHRTFYYPNKFLGDLVCAWMLLEASGAEDGDDRVAQTMLEAADYWEQNGWGWGEHMSDGYAVVCLQELSLLLLWAERLPGAVRERYRGLLADLLAIEDAFGEGPRVPAIRSYAFAKSPEHVNYRDRVKPLEAGEAPALEHLFHPRGWHDLAPARTPPLQDTEFRCWGGARAVGRCEPDARLGSMTRYPIMPEAEHDTWGLCWQSFPVCFWRPAGDWGFLQWEVRAGERTGCHPSAGSFYTSYGNAALALGVNPPVAGRTWAIQRGGNVLVLRVLPAIAAGWERVTDRLRVLSCGARVAEACGEDGFRRLTLGYPEREIGTACLPLTPGADSLQAQKEGRVDWEFRWEGEALAARRAIVLLWGLTLEGPITEAPVLTPDPEAPVVPRDPEEQAWRVTWRWPAQEWRVRIDPRAEEALREG